MKREGRKGMNVILAVVLSLIGGTVSPAVLADSDTVNLTFNYTVLQGTCDVTVGSDGVNGLLAFPDVSVTGTTLPTNWGPLAGSSSVQVFSVRLTKCAGQAAAGKSPGLEINGDTDSSAGASADSKMFLFVNNAAPSPGDAKGFGFVITKDNVTPASNYKNSLIGDKNKGVPASQRYIAIPNKGAGTAVTSDTTVPLKAYITCGDKCNTVSSLKAGDLRASVTFHFLYH
ncbi:fimbrial protein [Serratia sp. 2723]|uniref:fimbrial protein n=1 Tax=unclassified Serratia (in: enterobacteria) TaxID=2647522 RepID=UPI003D1BD5CB